MEEHKQKFKTDLLDRSYKFGLAVIRLTDTLPNKRSAWVITDQVIRSSTSVGANLTEAKAASTRLEFKRYYEIALKSANESAYWLKMLGDAGLVKKEQNSPLLSELSELSSMIAVSVKKLKRPQV